ncbi:MAG: hypothetical protein AAGA72_16975 [Pseudomonadota bacterium]
MRMVRWGLAAMGLAFLQMSAIAGPRQTLHFVQAPHILVWQNGILMGEGDEIQLTGAPAGAPEMIVGGGALVPVRSLPPGAVQTLTLQIASNCGFVLEAADPAEARQVQVTVLGHGANASVRRAATHIRSTVVFEQTEKTAVRPGPVQTQAISIALTWSGVGPRALWLRTVPS